MGIDVIKLTEGQDQAPALREQDLAQIRVSLHQAPEPAMSVWLMAMASGQPAFPWWSYGRAMDEDVNKLAAMTGISSPQGLFDFLFLLQLKKTFPAGVFALIPGNVKKDGWASLSEPAQNTLQRGQSCVYRLEASLNRKIAVNWVPFYQPQVMVKDPSGDNLVRFFNAAKSDDVANSISFVGVGDVRKLPHVVNLLVHSDDKRSEKLAQLADWFGVYSSPLDEKHGTCAMAYTTSNAVTATFSRFGEQFTANVEAIRKVLLTDPSPAAVIKIVSRLVAL